MLPSINLNVNPLFSASDAELESSSDESSSDSESDTCSSSDEYYEVNDPLIVEIRRRVRIYAKAKPQLNRLLLLIIPN